eukprot:4607181-Amphidinium_carterae.2
MQHQLHGEAPCGLGSRVSDFKHARGHPANFQHISESEARHGGPGRTKNSRTSAFIRSHTSTSRIHSARWRCRWLDESGPEVPSSSTNISSIAQSQALSPSGIGSSAMTC